MLLIGRYRGGALPGSPATAAIGEAGVGVVGVSSVGLWRALGGTHKEVGVGPCPLTIHGRVLGGWDVGRVRAKAKPSWCPPRTLGTKSSMR